MAVPVSEINDSSDFGDEQSRLPTQLATVLEASGLPSRAQHIERRKGEPEADEPAPEAGLAPAFVEGEAEDLWEPIIVARKSTEDDAADDHVMEMGDQERAVVQH